MIYITIKGIHECEQVQMGVERCGWVRWGTGGMENTKTGQGWGVHGLKGQDSGPMAGEISPNIMFWETR